MKKNIYKKNIFFVADKKRIGNESFATRILNKVKKEINKRDNGTTILVNARNRGSVTLASVLTSLGVLASIITGVFALSGLGFSLSTTVMIAVVVVSIPTLLGCLFFPSLKRRLVNKKNSIKALWRKMRGKKTLVLTPVLYEKENTAKAREKAKSLPASKINIKWAEKDVLLGQEEKKQKFDSLAKLFGIKKSDLHDVIELNLSEQGLVVPIDLTNPEEFTASLMENLSDINKLEGHIREKKGIAEPIIKDIDKVLVVDYLLPYRKMNEAVNQLRDEKNTGIREDLKKKIEQYKGEINENKRNFFASALKEGFKSSYSSELKSPEFKTIQTELEKKGYTLSPEVLKLSENLYYGSLPDLLIFGEKLISKELAKNLNTDLTKLIEDLDPNKEIAPSLLGVINTGEKLYQKIENKTDNELLNKVNTKDEKRKADKLVKEYNSHIETIVEDLTKDQKKKEQVENSLKFLEDNLVALAYLNDESKTKNLFEFRTTKRGHKFRSTKRGHKERYIGKLTNVAEQTKNVIKRVSFKSKITEPTKLDAGLKYISYYEGKIEELKKGTEIIKKKIKKLNASLKADSISEIICHLDEDVLLSKETREASGKLLDKLAANKHEKASKKNKDIESLNKVLLKGIEKFKAASQRFTPLKREKAENQPSWLEKVKKILANPLYLEEDTGQSISTEIPGEASKNDDLGGNTNRLDTESDVTQTNSSPVGSLTLNSPSLSAASTSPFGGEFDTDSLAPADIDNATLALVNTEDASGNALRERGKLPSHSGPSANQQGASAHKEYDEELNPFGGELETDSLVPADIDKKSSVSVNAEGATSGNDSTGIIADLGSSVGDKEGIEKLQRKATSVDASSNEVFGESNMNAELSADTTLKGKEKEVVAVIPTEKSSVNLSVTALSAPSATASHASIDVKEDQMRRWSIKEIIPILGNPGGDASKDASTEMTSGLRLFVDQKGIETSKEFADSLGLQDTGKPIFSPVGSATPASSSLSSVGANYEDDPATYLTSAQTAASNGNSVSDNSGGAASSGFSEIFNGVRDWRIVPADIELALLEFPISNASLDSNSSGGAVSKNAPTEIKVEDLSLARFDEKIQGSTEKSNIFMSAGKGLLDALHLRKSKKTQEKLAKLSREKQEPIGRKKERNV